MSEVYERRADLDYIVDKETGFLHVYSDMLWEGGYYREPTVEELMANGLEVNSNEETQIVRITPMPENVMSMGWDDINDYIKHYGLGAVMPPMGKIETARLELRSRIDRKNDNTGVMAALQANLPDNFYRLKIPGLVKFASDNKIEVSPLASIEDIRLTITSVLSARITTAGEAA